MKNRIIRVLLLLSVIALISIPCVVPVMGQEDIIETDVAAQEESTNLLSGVSLVLINHINDEIYNEIEIKDKNEEKDWKSGWVTTNVNIRSLPTTDSKVYEVLNFNDEIEYIDFNDEWAEIQYEDTYAYVNKKYISDTATDGKIYEINDKKNFKSYMPFKSFCKSSKQYVLQQRAYTGNYGIRMINGRYTVAIGTRFIDDLSNCIGTYFDIVLENGEIIQCVVGDIKADKHTDSSNTYTVYNGCFTEFIVDTRVLNSDAKRDGNISSVKDEWNSPVDAIIVYDKKVDLE